MVVRAHLGVLLTDTAGTIQASTALVIQKADGSSLGQTIYNASTGGSSIPSPTTDSGGRFDGYVDVPVRARITPSGGTARVEDFAPNPGDIVIQNVTVPVVLGGYDGLLAALELRPLDDVNAYALRVRDDDGSDILRVRKSAAGRNLILIGDDGSLPETSLVHAYQSLSANSQQVVNIDAFVGAAGLVEVKAIAATVTQTIAGGGNLAAAKFLAVRGSATSVGETVAVKGWVQNGKAGGSAKLNVGLWASSVGAQVGDTALLVDGSGGWTNFLACYNSADALKFSVNNAGQVTAAGSVISSGSISGVNGTFTGAVVGASFAVTDATKFAVSAAGATVVNSLTVTTSMSVVSVSATGSLVATAGAGAGAPNLWLTGGGAGVSGIGSPSADVLVIGTSGTEWVRLLANGNLGYRTTAQFGSGVGVIGIANAGTNPSTNPTGGGVLYADAGAGKWRGSGGTTTTFGPAEPHCPTCDRDFALEWESERYGYLALCMWCLTDGFTRGVMARRPA